MKALKTWHAGRNVKPATIIPVPAAMEAMVFLAIFIESCMEDGYKVVASYGNPHTFCVQKRGNKDNPVLVIQLAEVAEAKQAS